MQDDLHRVRRRGFAVRKLGRLSAFGPWVLALASCSRPSAVVQDAGSAVEEEKPEPTAEAIADFARSGMEAADRLETSTDDRGAYLRLRRNVVASMSYWRLGLQMAAEASFGPEVAIQEAGGSLGALDRAIGSHNASAIHDAVAGVRGALRLSNVIATRIGVKPRLFGQSLSDAAYRLGQAVLESTPYVPDGDDAALADVLGFLDFIERGSAAMRLDVARELEPFARMRAPHALGDVTDRATLVRSSGILGSSIRRALRASGITTTLTYRPLRDAPDIHALTLPQPALPADPRRAELGRRLFFDPRLARNRARACATCHVPDRAYTDGRATPLSLDPAVPLRRNTPTLLYAPLEAVLTWDGRVRTADRQALMVIHTASEMGSSDDEIVRAVAADARYERGFHDAFTDGVTAQNIASGIAAFESQALVPANAPIDRFARGDDTALSPDARAGLDVFAGKGRCARCHIPPVFGGSRPPDFTAPVFAVLGVPSAPGATAVDSDSGRAGAFRVPTLRDVGRTAPYFHHGRYKTLDQVIDFYVQGGGRGLGLDVPNQDPEVRRLSLTADDKRLLSVFMVEALDDTR